MTDSTDYQPNSVVVSLPLRFYRLILTLLLFTTGPVSAAPDATAEPLVISYRIDSDPIQFRNESGEADGIMIDLWRLWSRKSGIPVRFVASDNAAAQEMVRSGEADINAGLFLNQRRAEFLAFSQPILSSPYHIYFHENLEGLTDTDKLHRFRVGVTRSSFHEDYFREHFPATELVLFDGYRALFDAAQRGDVRVFVTQPLYLNRYLAIRGSANHYRTLESPLYVRSYRAAVKKGRSALLASIDQHLVQITDTERAAITGKWLGTGWALNKPGKLLLSDAEEAWLDKHRSIRLGVDPSWPPFEFFDEHGSYQGLGADFIALFSGMLDVDMQPVMDLSWEEVMAKVRNGELDVLPAVKATPERRRFLDFTKPYLVYPYVIFVHQDTRLVTGLGDLSGKRVAVEKAYATEELLRSNHPDLTLITFQTTSEALFALSRGDVDAFVSNLSAAAWVIDKLGLNDVKVAAPTPYRFEQSIGVRKDWPELLAMLNRAIDQVTPEQRQLIKNRWFKVRFEHEVDMAKIRRVSLMVAAVTFLIFLVMMYWNRRLQREIVRRKRTESELESAKDAVIEASQEKFRNLIEGSIQGVWVHVDWKPVFANQALADILGYESVNEILQLSSIEPCIAPYELARLRRYGGERLKGDSAPAHYEFDALRKDGGLVTLDNMVRVVEWDGRQALQSTLVDVTERKQAAIALKESEERLSRFFGASFEGLFFHDQGTIVDANPAVEKIFGYTPDETLGKSLLEFVTPEYRPMVQENMQAGNEGPYEVSVMSKAGIPVPAEVRARTIELRGKLSRVVSLHDVTELKQAELALQKAHDLLEDKVAERTLELAEANARLTELDQLKSMFIASMSHELRTPLNAIIGFTGIILQGMTGELNPEQRDQLNRVYGAAKHLLALISDVIDISKVEAGRVDVIATNFILEEVVEEAIDSVRSAFEEKGLVLDVDIPDKLLLHTDRKRLLQCVLNLLSNAVKYTESGSVAIVAHEDGDAVVISVIDTGIGIDEQQLPKLFEPFERIDSHLRVKTPGTGLGLYLTRKLASELLEGTVTVETRAGSGSTFRLRIAQSLESPKAVAPLSEV